jgi:CHAD domain-containing protein
MTPTSQTEIERKYDVESSTAVPDLSDIGRVDGPHAVELEALYFDTATNDLARERVTLRRRTGGKDAGWHLKLPSGVDRTEVHAPITDPMSPGGPWTVPNELLDPVRSIVRDRELTPVARIHTRRTIRTLLDGEDHAAVEIADDEVSATDVRSGVARLWREWEAELLGVTDENLEQRMLLLERVEERLLGAGAAASSSRSKLARTLGRDSLGSPEEQRSPEGQPGAGEQRGAEAQPPDAFGLATAIARSLVAALERADAGVRADEPDSIHSMRTIVRRLRSVLASFSGVFDRRAVDDLRQRLRRLGSVLGEARDLEVRAASAERELENIPPELQDEESTARLVEGDRVAFGEARDRVLAYLSSSTYYRLLDSLDDFVASPRSQDPAVEKRASEPAERLVRRALRTASKRTLTRANNLPETEEAGDEYLAEFHEVRKAARRLRYTAEAILDADPQVTGPRVLRLARRAERVQDMLGEHRDGILFAEHLMFESNRAHAAGEKTFVYGALYSKSGRDAHLAVERFPAAIGKIGRSSKKL